MTLLAVRTNFISLSGRYDLVVNTTAYVDNGANFHINAGQKYLDKLLTIPENTAVIYDNILVDEYSITFQNHCRSIESVFINSTTSRTELEQLSLSELKTMYADPASDTDNGTPLYYALANLRALETTDQASLATFINNTHADSDTKYNYRGLILVPPADTTYTVEVTGKFSQKVLALDTDENWWTEEYSNILIMGALRSLEVFNRNSEGVRDWEMAIRLELSEIDKDSANEESYNVTQMQG